MKRFVLFSFFVFLVAAGNIFAQQKEYSHWSLGLKGGVTRGEFSGSGILADDAKYGFAFGVELERTFNPLWGIALEYEYVNYSNFDIDAYTNEIGLLGSVNLSNLLAKYRRGNWQRLNLYGRLGAGLSFYRAQTDATTIVLPMGASLEYNVCKHLALGLTGERRWHTSNSMGLGREVEDKVVIWSALANVRIKFGAKQHIRDTKLTDYEAVFMEEANRYDDAPLKKALSDNENAVNQLKDQLNKANTDLNRLNNDLIKANSDINKTKEELAKCCQEKANTTSPLAPTNNNIHFKNVEFNFNEYAILPSFQSELDMLAEIMKSQPNLKLEIVGHTDNSGGEKLNQELSINRARAAADYLIEKGVGSDRIMIKGMGYSKPTATNSTAEGRQKNRRIEFTFTK